MASESMTTGAVAGGVLAGSVELVVSLPEVVGTPIPGVSGSNGGALVAPAEASERVAVTATSVPHAAALSPMVSSSAVSRVVCTPLTLGTDVY